MESSVEKIKEAKPLKRRKVPLSAFIILVCICLERYSATGTTGEHL